MSAGVLVVGGGHCAGQLVAALRAAGYADPVRIVGDEPFRPYQRPPLSKGFLTGKLEREQVFLQTEERFADLDVELVAGSRVSSIDRAARTVTLDDGSRLDYADLVLATGSRPRRLDFPGADLDGVLYLRDLADAEQLRERLVPGGRLVVVGGGYIGLEVAASAVTVGLEVTVLETAARVMGRVVSEPVSSSIEGLHDSRGVTVLTGARVERCEGDASVHGVRTANGKKHAADVVVVGVGVVPNVELAAKAGLAVEDGIVVDEHGRTADRHVWAAGDCTRHPNAIYGRSVRLECVQNAVGQGRAVAAALAGNPVPYRELPWFWSDQYNMKLQIAGLSGGHDQTVERGDPEEPGYTFFYLQDSRIIAAETLGAPRDHLACRKLIAAGTEVDDDELGDPTVPLSELSAV